MYFSISSVLISVVFAGALIFILEFVLSNVHCYKTFRIDFLSILSIIISLRLFFPFEFINAHTISSYKVLPALVKLGKQKIVLNSLSISILHFVEVIWIVGILFKLLIFFHYFIKFKKFSMQLKNISKNQLDSRIHSIIPSNVELFYYPAFISPFACGLFHPKIVLTKIKMNSTDKQYILKHELLHIDNLDILKKYFIEILVCFYWWFPPIYLFRKQIDLILEMRVDNKIVKNKASNEYSCYINSLMNISKRIVDYNKNYIKFSNFSFFEENTLKRRILFLLEGYNFKKTGKLIRLILIVLPLLLTSIIVEPNFYNRRDFENTFEVNSKNQYILKKGKKYYLVVNGKVIARIKHFSNNEDPNLNKLHIIVKE